jgi:hypothetical protein
VFFFGRIHRVFFEKGHGLTAADEFSGAAMDYFDDVPTEFTFINFKFFSHFFASL